MTVLLKLAIVFTVAVAVPLASCQMGVCSYRVSETQVSYRVTQESYIYSYSCGVFWWSRCSRTAYRSRGVYSSSVVYHTVTTCCSGYTGDGTQCSPICTDCTDREVCVAPEECVCSAGWTGENCTEDEDECLSIDICHHFCTNTPGSYYCTCEDDSVLAHDQSSCLDSPQNTRLIAIRSTSLNLTWERPDWNGTIIEYISSCSSNRGTFHNANVPSQTSYNIHLNALSPHTTYTCCVTANTTHGVSHSACDTQTTLEDVPSDSPVNVTVAAVSPFAVEIEWRPPTTPNGIIVIYTVYVSGIFVATVNGTQTSYLYRSLPPYELVTVSVTSSTKIGEGPRSIEASNRTQETVPLKGPSGLSVNRTEATVAVVMWEPLSIEDLRGNLSSYEIVYYEVSDEQCPQNTTTNDKTVSVEVRESVFFITELDPGLQYCVGMAAKTSAGVGEFSFSFVPWFTNTVFTLSLVGIDRCTQWRLNMISERAMEIAHEVSKGIELICRCNLSSDYITDEKFTCENDNLVIFHGRIISTNDKDSSDLAGYLEEWVSTKPTIVVQGKELQVISSDVHMEQEDSQLSGTVVGAVVPVIILLLLISAVTLVSGMILFRRRIKRSYTSHKISGSTTNPVGHESEDSGEVLREFSNTLYDTNHHISRSHPVPQNRTTHTATPYAETVISHEEPNAGDTTSAEGVYSEVTAGREVNVYDAPR